MTRSGLTASAYLEDAEDIESGASGGDGRRGDRESRSEVRRVSGSGGRRHAPALRRSRRRCRRTAMRSRTAARSPPPPGCPSWDRRERGGRASSFLILHGWQNRRPPEHWQHWLADRLREEGAQVVYPQLPDPDAPRPEVWLEELRRYLTQLDGEERVVIAHSLGTLLWLHHARDGGDPVDRVLLVSPPGPSHPRLRSRASSLLSSAPSPLLRQPDRPRSSVPTTTPTPSGERSRLTRGRCGCPTT